jgi:thiazole biosynthesis/tRNA modification protein ThiI
LRVEISLSGEIALKGPRTRHNMQFALIRNLESVVKVKDFNIEGGIIYADIEGEVERLSKVFGIAKYWVVEEFMLGNLEELANFVEERFRDVVKNKTFAVRVRRVGQHSFTSVEAAKVIGSRLHPYSKGVDLKNPQVEVKVDIRYDKALLKLREFNGPKGLPVGTTGKTVALISGGFDSAVAAWFLMKRGSEVVALNFALGGAVHVEAVKKVVKALNEWSSGHVIPIYVVPGDSVLTRLALVNESVRVVVLKRVMYRTAEALAKSLGAHSITTGESLSQVSSQTGHNLFVTNYGIDVPVLRPLIGFDKDEIVETARRIGTYEISARLPEYCALSTKSSTHVSLEEVLKAEEELGLDYEKLYEPSQGKPQSSHGSIIRHAGVLSSQSLREPYQFFLCLTYALKRFRGALEVEARNLRHVTPDASLLKEGGNLQEI